MYRRSRKNPESATSASRSNQFVPPPRAVTPTAWSIAVATLTITPKSRTVASPRLSKERNLNRYTDGRSSLAIVIATSRKSRICRETFAPAAGSHPYLVLTWDSRFLNAAESEISCARSSSGFTNSGASHASTLFRVPFIPSLSIGTTDSSAFARIFSPRLFTA